MVQIGGSNLTLVFALLLDAALGEPKWLWKRLPHPTVLIGGGISKATSWLNHTPNQKSKGVILVILLVATACLFGAALAQLGLVFQIIVAAILIAQKSLVQHMSAVADALRMSLEQGRNSVSMIVGRDTEKMNTPQVARAAIESGAENFSDGIVAPVFWFIIAGLPGLLVYKAVNTADSMIGYTTEEYLDFGWAAARLDDFANWIPARLAAIIIWLITGRAVRWQKISQDASLHRSPNAGWPEAAMAYGIGVSLSGPRSYDGKMQNFSWVNANGEKYITSVDIERSVNTLWGAWCALLIIVTLISLTSYLPVWF
jgi:adenosylcobinamide-phosphate synthase